MSSKNSFRPAWRTSLRLNIAPQPKAVRAREPITPSRGKVRVQFPSKKLGRMIACESQLEQKFCYHAEFSPAITNFREQPLSIRYQMNGKLLRYTPDFELTFYNRELWYVEIKPHNKLQQQEIKSRLQHIAKFWVDKNYNFIVVTDQELNFPTRLRNLVLLRAYLRLKIEVSDLKLVRDLFENKNIAYFDELVTIFGSTPKVFALIAQHHLTTNLDQELCFDSQLKLPRENFHETCLFTYRSGPNFGKCAISDC